MAAVRSLGLHTPSALPYLIAESLLPPDPSPSLYSWETFTDGGAEEELLITKDCVVWSRGRVVRKLFSFDLEQETVYHAVLAWFPAHEDTPIAESSFGISLGEGGRAQKKLRVSTDGKTSGLNWSDAHHEDSDRALVVFLKAQAHVYFLSGATHVVHLPFEVEKAFPAAKGLILQRKLAPPISVQPTPILPSAPNNSFLSPLSQRGPRQKSNGTKAQRKSLNPFNLDSDLLYRNGAPLDDHMPRHYSFSSPLADLGLLVSAPGSNDRLQPGDATATRQLTALGKDEDMIYMSSGNEIDGVSGAESPVLFLAVTANYQRGVYSVWHASYMEFKPVSKALTGKSTPTAGAKTRRRSSFVTATGATTPVARPRESLRESFGGGTRGKALSSSQRRDLDGQGAEDAFASQVDPDFEPRQPARESRRVSSMMSRAELNTSFDRNAFQDLASQHSSTNVSSGPAGRRGHSLGASFERPSFGPGSQRRLRASTPGSFSRLSIDDASDTGTVLNLGVNASFSSTVDEMDGFVDPGEDFAGLETLDLHHPLDGLKREIVLVKFAEIPMHSTSIAFAATGSLQVTWLISYHHLS
jgi:anaphase-promoting complex subunit 1